MSPEQQIQQAQRRIRNADVMMGEAFQLDDIAARLMTAQRYWSAPNREAHLSAALDDSRAAWNGIQTSLAEGSLDLPADVQHNLLILSVYAQSKIDACEAGTGAEVLGSLIALTRTLSSSLKEWQVAA